jgi:hypothetical protein
MEGWQKVQGTFDRTTTGAGANLSAAYLASSTLLDSACDEVRSPIIKLTPSSTLTIYNQFSTEPMSDAWYDRGNVGIVDVATGARSAVVPSSGRPYLADGPNGVCVVSGQRGWAGPGPGWLPSGWAPADLVFNDGRKVQIDVGYGTDPTASLTGLWIDDVTITNFYEQGSDTQPNL